MKILLDECVDHRFRAELTGHDVRTVSELGWAGLKNGELLTRAQDDFDVFLTIDAGIPFQQNLQTFKIAVVLLHAKSNRFEDLKLLASALLEVLTKAEPGKLLKVGAG